MKNIGTNKIKLNKAPFTMHEFFAGSGLVAYGLKGMFAPIWANDISPEKAAVYKANFKSDYFILGDVKNVHGADLPTAHLSWASFPCQDLSLAGTVGGIDAQRSGLVWQWLRVLDEMPQPPKLLLMENVSGLLSANGGKNYVKLHSALMDREYNAGAILLDAVHFVPQSRPRIFVIAVKRDAKIPTELLGAEPCWLHNKAAVEIGKSLKGWIWWRTERPVKRKTTLKDIIDEMAPFDKDDVLRLITERHQKKLDAHNDVIATGYRRTREGKQQLELRTDGISGCLRTSCGGSSKEFIIVKRNGETHARLLTVREAARLMGAPDSFKLPGTYNDGYTAMGDAVVVPVAKFLGERFLKPLAEAIYNE